MNQNILVGLFMSYITGSSSQGSAINVVGDAFVNQDPASVAQAFTDLITSLDLTCAFQVGGSRDVCERTLVEDETTLSSPGAASALHV